MKTITIYELLGMVKDGKAPKEIRYNDEIWNYDDNYNNYYFFSLDTECREYLFNNISIEHLNDEVEIIEDTPKENKNTVGKVALDVDNDVNGSYDIVIINGIEYEINKVERYMFVKINEIIDTLEMLNDKIK